MARWSSVAIIIICATQVQLARGDIGFSQVAHSGMSAPGTGTTFGAFAPPSLRAGEVGFLGYVIGSNALFSTAGGLHAIVTNSTPIPGGSGTFMDVSDASFDGSSFAFQGRPSLSVPSGVYSSAGGMHTVIDRTMAIPGGPGNFLAAGTPAHREGNSACIGYGAGGFTGVYSTVGGLHRVADSTMQVPEGGANFAGFHFQWFDFDGQSVFFRATSTAGIDGIYTDAGGSLHAAVRTGDLLPSGATIGSVAEPAADHGAVAFQYAVGFETGIASTYGGPLSIVADEHTQVPGRNRRFNAGVSHPSMDDGNVAFEGGWVTPTEDDYGIYVRYNGVLMKIIDTTDSLGGKPIAYLNMSNEAFEGNQLAFQVEFEDQTQAVYVATLPEPAAMSLLGFGLLLGLRRCKPVATCPKRLRGMFRVDGKSRGHGTAGG